MNRERTLFPVIEEEIPPPERRLFPAQGVRVDCPEGCGMWAYCTPEDADWWTRGHLEIMHGADEGAAVLAVGPDGVKVIRRRR